MNIYLYNPKTLEFTKQEVAFESPLEKGVFLIPADATTIPPPDPIANQAAVFDGKAWSTVPDWRFVPLWNTTTAQPDATIALGVLPADVGLTTLQPPSTPCLFVKGAWVADAPAAKVARNAEITKARDAQLQAGVMYAGHLFDTDQTGISNLTATIAAVDGGMALPPGFVWRSKDNVNVPMTITDLKALAQAMLYNAYVIYATSWAQKDAP